MENAGRDIGGDTMWKWLSQAEGKGKGDGEELWVQQSIFSPYICHEIKGPDAMILGFCMLSFKPAFYSPLSPSS